MGRDIKDLTKEELMEIYNNSQNGIYYAKETCERFNITYYTYQKVIAKMRDYIKKCLDE